MHITILALGSRGDIQPYAILGKGLRAAGHEVRFITFENYAGLVEEHELDFYPIQGDAQALVARAGASTLALIRSFSALAQGYARDLSAPCLGETDLILNQLPAGLYGFDLAEKYGVPLVLASVIPLASTRAFPLMGFPKLRLPGYNRATYVLGEQIAWQIFRPVINRWRKQTLALPPLPIRGYYQPSGIGPIPILNGFSSLVVPRPADWGEPIHVTGYWFEDDPGWQPPADLLAFLDAGSPPVFFCFGSMPVKDPQKTTRILLDALQQSAQRGIIQQGWGGIGNQALPDTVFKIGYAPYGWLFPRMGMVFHHGGSGTTAYALRSGIPSCAISFAFDQYFWGERITGLGAGPKPIRYRQLSVEKLSQAIQLGVNNSQMRKTASEVGKKLRAENGIANACQVIEQVLQERRVKKN